ncbi:ferritin-like domain-containing protein [Imbroritus primus]|uniref:ferritin-like domain-containing protein n=1 Tax=Imbroritus primus TaxID=3058603 RepID=UPI003D16191A
MSTFPCIRRAALAALCQTNPAEKARTVRALAADGATRPDAAFAPALRPADFPADWRAAVPGRPAQPELVSARFVPRRAVVSREGRAALLHALAHIEFNAINLALDAVWRFDGMPVPFYRDWLKVAGEEAYHFSLLAEHLARLDAAYGDFPAHNGLWEMAEKTRDDVLARMALVPRTLEARGLDASPPIRARLAQAGDMEAASILDVILRDEVGHVAIGNRWYRWCCARAGVDPLATYDVLVERYDAPRLRGPFNFEARAAAGFDAAELAQLRATAPDVPSRG